MSFSRRFRKALRLLPALILFWMNCAGAAVPIFYVDARGKTGTQIGVSLGQAIKSRFPDIEARLDRYLSTFTDQSTFNNYLVPRMNAVKSNLDQRFKDEIAGLASGLSVSAGDALGDGKLSLNELWVLELTTDVLRTTNCSGFGVFGDHSDSGPIVGRNLDWPTYEDIRGIQAVIVYQYQDRTLVSIGFAGSVGVLSGFNDHGLFAGILDSPMGGTYPNPEGKRSYAFDLRTALETCTTISGAAEFLYKKPYTYSHNILFADKTDVKVLEHPQGVNGALRDSGSTLNYDLPWGKTNQIAVVNFFSLPGYMNGRDYPYRDFNYVRWYRLKDLAVFSPANKATVSSVESIMLDQANYQNAILNSQTVQSMVFTPMNRKLYLYTVPVSGIHDQPAMERVRIANFTRGDMNDDGHIDLVDLILMLRTLADFSVPWLIADYGDSGADVNNDGKAGMEEALFIMQAAAGIR